MLCQSSEDRDMVIVIFPVALYGCEHKLQDDSVVVLGCGDM
jgi:hypothetical protein